MEPLNIFLNLDVFEVDKIIPKLPQSHPTTKNSDNKGQWSKAPSRDVEILRGKNSSALEVTVGVATAMGNYSEAHTAQAR